MIRTVEAVIDALGRVQLIEPVALERDHRAFTILEEEPATHAHETALWSEVALADWGRKEEDQAWSRLQQV
jgi:hypothetical protein